jgi:20S proteasome subunit alpha 3
MARELRGISAQSLLKQDYKDDMSLEDAKALALKIMSKTMDSTKLGSEKREFYPFLVFFFRGGFQGDSLLTFARLLHPAVEFATLTLHPKTQEPLPKIFRASELDALLRANGLGGTVDEAVGVGEGTGGGGGGGGDVAVST